MPSLENLRNTLSGEHFEVLAIDVGEDRIMVEGFIKKNGYTFPVLLDSDGKVSNLYDVRSHPRTFLISPAGRVIGIAVGYRKWDTEAMLMLMRKLLQSGSNS